MDELVDGPLDSLGIVSPSQRQNQEAEWETNELWIAMQEPRSHILFFPTV